MATLSGRGRRLRDLLSCRKRGQGAEVGKIFLPQMKDGVKGDNGGQKKTPIQLPLERDASREPMPSAYREEKRLWRARDERGGRKRRWKRSGKRNIPAAFLHSPKIIANYGKKRQNRVGTIPFFLFRLNHFF